MELVLQFGWGMMDLSLELISESATRSVILSPRDLQPTQLIRMSRDILSLGGSVYLDPQFYLPRSDHHRLISHEYWPANYDTVSFDLEGRTLMIRSLSSLNDELDTAFFIVPGERAAQINEDWLSSQAEFLESASRVTGKPLMVTVCLSDEVIRSTDQISLLMEFIESNSTPAYYLVFERPGNSYLVEDPQWLSNTLDIVAGLKLGGAYVLVGYSNHQQLIMSCASVDALASGTWMNVRSFFPSKFRSDYETEIKRRNTWYYLPQALSEYTLPYLDIGFRLGLKDQLRPDPLTRYATPLFEVVQPSAIGWSEPEAFRHYLVALSLQISNSVQTSFDETVRYHRDMLSRADDLLKMLISADVRGRPREFLDSIDANRAALRILESTNGPLLRRRWNELSP